VGAANLADVTVGERALSVKRQLISALYRKYADRPALVVGGGPSAPEQLLRISQWLNPFYANPPLIVAANGHATRLGLTPDFIVCKDHVHTETKEFMEHKLRPIGAPLVSRYHWAEYRLANWPSQGNSGMMALAVAVLLGCRPVVPIGLDCYQKGTYFHDLDAKNVSGGLRESNWRSRYQRLSNRLEQAPIRAAGGFLGTLFRPFDPTERFDRAHMPVSLQIYADMPSIHVRSLPGFQFTFDRGVAVPPGTEFPVSPLEFASYGKAGFVAPIDNPAPAVV
jgi:hypothetical protein